VINIGEKFDAIKEEVFGKTKIELERDKRYESRWVWYHTFLAGELFVIIILLILMLGKL